MILVCFTLEEIRGLDIRKNNHFRKTSEKLPFDLTATSTLDFLNHFKKFDLQKRTFKRHKFEHLWKPK